MNNMDGEDITITIGIVCIMITVISLFIFVGVVEMKEESLESETIKAFLESEEFTSEQKLEMMKMYLIKDKDKEED